MHLDYLFVALFVGSQFGSPPSGMGRGFGGYGTMAPAYAGTPPLVGAGYGYGNSTTCGQSC